MWESTGHNHQSTAYSITGFDQHLWEPTIYIEGGRGGQYEIVVKGNDHPWIRYLPKNQPKDYGWQERLVRLAILTPDFEYIDQNGWQAFLSNPFEILKNLY